MWKGQCRGSRQPSTIYYLQEGHDEQRNLWLRVSFTVGARLTFREGVKYATP